MEEFDYFMIRIRRPAPGAPARTVSGVVERLGTGEKRSFESSEELLHFVSGDPRRMDNMQPEAASGNR